MVEVNTVYSEKLEPRLTQIILWRFYEPGFLGPDLYVANWYAVKPLSVERRRGNKHYVSWIYKRRLYRVITGSYRQTHTFNDPEVDDRIRVDSDERKKYFDANGR